MRFASTIQGAVALVVVATPLFFCGPSTASEPTQTNADPSALLTAMNFVLTGSDHPFYQPLAGAPCTVISEGEDDRFVVYFKTIDVSRVTLQKSDVRYPYKPEPEHWIVTEIHGTGVVFERRGISTTKQKNADGTETDIPGAAYSYPERDHTIRFQSTEYDRILRAWQYIYSHGCKGAAAGF